MTGADPRLRVWSGDWLFLGAWVLGAVGGYAAAVQAHMAQLQVVLVCAAFFLAAYALAWVVGRVVGRPQRSAPKPRTMGATGAVVVTLLGWWSLLLVLNPIVVYWRPPLYTVQNFVWFMAGLQIAELVGRAVEHRGRRTPAANVTPQKA